MLELKNVSKIYKSKKSNDVIALKEINLLFENTGLIFISGKSGCGKSTLLNIIGGLDNYTHGEIIFDGISTSNYNEKNYDHYRNNNIGFIFQDYNLIDEYNIFHNIEISTKLQGKEIEPNVIKDLLKSLDVNIDFNRLPNDLSGGQKQRIAIARAIIKNPRIILADEPTGALDTETGKQILEILKKLSKEKLVIIVSHDKENACLYADRIIELTDGIVTTDNIINNIKQSDLEKTIRLTKECNIRSSLPKSEAFKLGITNLKHKKLRLFLVVLLAAFAFTLFGLTTTTVFYNQNKITLKSMYEADISYLAYNKTQKTEDEILGKADRDIFMSSSDINYLRNKFSNYDFYPVFHYFNNSYSNHFNIDEANINKSYHKSKISGTMEINNKILEKLDIPLLVGRLPINNFEIVITKYMFLSFLEYGYSYKYQKINVENLEDILGLEIGVNNHNLKIVGVLDTHFDEKRYEAMFDNKFNNIDAVFADEIDVSVNYGLHGLIFVREGFYNDVLLSNKYKNIFSLQKFLFEENDFILNNSFYSKLKPFENAVAWKNNEKRNNLKENEIIISLSTIKFNKDNWNDLINAKAYQMVNDFAVNQFDEIHEAFIDRFYNDPQYEFYQNENYQYSDYTQFILKYSNDMGNIFHMNLDYNHFFNIAFQDFIQEHYFNEEHYLTMHESSDTSPFKKLEVVGVYYKETIYNDFLSNTIMISDSFFDELAEKYHLYEFNSAITVLSGKYQSDIKLIQFSHNEMNSFQFRISNIITKSIAQIEDQLRSLTKLSLVITLILSLFSGLLLFNYITISITHRSKEIGILRSLGATKKDIFNIFFSKSFMISILNSIVAFISTYFLIQVVNKILAEDYQLFLILFSFDHIPMISILTLSIFTAFLSTILPIYKLASKKPIETIRNIDLR